MKNLFLALILLGPYFLYSQVGIGTTEPHVSALLELNSNNSGLLIPRMTASQRINDINTPVTGLLVYQTDVNEGFYYFDGSVWLALSEDGDSDSSNELELPQSPNPGDMSYWTGTDWEVIPATVNEGATLQMKGGVPTWVGGIDPNIKIGDFIEGGVVFYLAPTPTDLDGDGDLDTGLVSAIQDSGISQWYNGGALSSIPGILNGIGKGRGNTQIIINAQGNSISDYAAGIASLYNGYGFSDWFLPSKEEMEQMFINLNDINSGSVANGGSALSEINPYWTSSEFDIAKASSAWVYSTVLNIFIFGQKKHYYL
jgi:hypothetical protein